MNDSLRRGGAVAALVAALVLLALGAWVAWRSKDATARPRAAPARSAAADVAPAPPSEPSDTATEAKRAEARRARDAMRAEILAALRRRDAGSAAAPRPPAPTPASTARAAAQAEDEPPHGHYEASYIREHFRADMFPLLKSCYADALTRRPSLAGKLVLQFAIVGDQQVGGIVESARFADESDLKDTPMETCVRESLMTLTFDKPPEGGGMVTVTYPIEFSPDPDPEEGREENGTHDG
jgi:hypothetical protein